MSVWTSVAGIARIDCVKCMISPAELLKDALKEHFGKEVHYHDDHDIWRDYDEHPEEFLPCGSEGSLRIDIWENSDPSHAAAFTVSIFGDLRDYEDDNGIIEWFKEKLELKPFSELPVWVRQASIVAQVDSREPKSYCC